MQGYEMTAKQIKRRALNLNKKLRALEKEAEELAECIRDYAYNGEKDGNNYDLYIYYLRDLEIVLDDLASFDLEDHIPVEIN